MGDKKPIQQDLFMRLNNPNTFRKNLLESSKLTLIIIKQTYTIKQLRESKQEHILQISEKIKELKLLLQEIDELMPKHSKDELKKLLPEMSMQKSKPDQKKDSKEANKEVKNVKEENPQAPPPMSELDKLTQALDLVQKKLQKL
jgi:hypothetical protein